MNAKIAAIVLLVVVGFATAQNQCRYLPNINITAADIEPAKFMVSSYDCCVACDTNPRCAAAIYSNYLCHLKASTSPQVQAIGPTLIVNAQGPTAKPQPTVVPSPTAPAPTVVPAPTIPPPVSNNVTLIVHTKCDYSHTCSRLNDGSCTSRGYFNNVCYGEQLLWTTAGSSFINVEKTAADNCSGTNVVEQQPKNQCQMDENDQYYGYFALDVNKPKAGLHLTMWTYPYACDQGGSASNTQMDTGHCYVNQFAWCFPDGGVVALAKYPGSGCTGTPTITVLPLNACYMDQNQIWYKNTCEQL